MTPRPAPSTSVLAALDAVSTALRHAVAAAREDAVPDTRRQELARAVALLDRAGTELDPSPTRQRKARHR